jgi:phosphatidylglycerol:prolipoprotein diacylglycerol transferase
MWAFGLLAGVWWACRRARKVKADPDLVLDLGFVILFVGMAGGRLFHVIHYWEQEFADDPWRIVKIASGGFEFYGGLILAFAATFLYLLWKRASVRLYGDIVAPSLLFGMGVGRIGCFMFGCCWGGPCPDGLPWAARFPYSSPPQQRQWEDRLVTLPAEMIVVPRIAPKEAGPIPPQIASKSIDDLRKQRQKEADAFEKDQTDEDAGQIAGAHARIVAFDSLIDHFEMFETNPQEIAAEMHRPEHRSHPVHPVQLYAAAGCLLLAWLGNSLFYRRERHGIIMPLLLMLYAVQRFVEEVIRIDNPHDTLGMTVSQGVSIIIVVLCAGGLLILRQMPARSPCLERAAPES